MILMSSTCITKPSDGGIDAKLRLGPAVVVQILNCSLVLGPWEMHVHACTRWSTGGAGRSANVILCAKFIEFSHQPPVSEDLLGKLLAFTSRGSGEIVAKMSPSFRP